MQKVAVLGGFLLLFDSEQTYNTSTKWRSMSIPLFLSSLC